MLLLVNVSLRSLFIVASLTNRYRLVNVYIIYIYIVNS